MTMTLVSTVTVGAGGAASIEFTSIPQTGTDLILVVSARINISGLRSAMLDINNSSGVGLSSCILEGTGSAATSGTQTDIFARAHGTTANTFFSASFYLPNYTSSVNKAYSIDTVSEANATSAYQTLIAGLWSNTAAVNRLKIWTGDLFEQYSTASLYTITKGSGGATVS